jgi:hypothetical protein
VRYVDCMCSCMFLCVCVCARVYTFMHTCACVSVSVCVFMYACVRECAPAAFGERVITLLNMSARGQNMFQEEDINCWVLRLPMQDMPVPLPDAQCLPLLDKAAKSAKSQVSAFQEIKSWRKACLSPCLMPSAFPCWTKQQSLPRAR